MPRLDAAMSQDHQSEIEEANFILPFLWLMICSRALSLSAVSHVIGIPPYGANYRAKISSSNPSWILFLPDADFVLVQPTLAGDGHCSHLRSSSALVR